MNYLFLELARTVKQLPAIPEAVKIGMIAQAIHDSNCGKTLLATKALNFWMIRYSADLKRYCRPFFIRGDRTVFCEFDDLKVGAAAYLKILSRPQFEGWHLKMFPADFVVFVAEKMGRGAGEYPKKIIEKIPEARAVWGAL